MQVGIVRTTKLVLNDNTTIPSWLVNGVTRLRKMGLCEATDKLRDEWALRRRLGEREHDCKGRANGGPMIGDITVQTWACVTSVCQKLRHLEAKGREKPSK